MMSTLIIRREGAAVLFVLCFVFGAVLTTADASDNTVSVSQRPAPLARHNPFSSFQPADNQYYNDDWYDEAWDPFMEMERMQHFMNSMFRHSLRHGFLRPGAGFGGRRGSFFEPDMDVRETDDAYSIHLDLPGMDKDKIEVSVADNMITVQGERRVDNQEKSEDAEGRYAYFRRERSFGAFRRTIPIPENVKQDEIKAEYNNGVLTITLPKRESRPLKARGKKIQVV